jgi:predicted phage-related endonuclease
VVESVLSVANPHQHTDAWWRARRGKITGSRMHVIMNGGARAWQTLADRLRLEALTDEVPEPDIEHVPAIAHGRKYEPIARTNAELVLGYDFELPGFRQHPQYEFIGCSADFCAVPLPGEIKAPLVLERHMEVYRTQRMPEEHIPQVQCEIAVYNAPAALFVSYHPDAAHWKMRTVIVKVDRDEDYIERMLARCNEFMRALHEHRSPSAPARTIPKLF